MHSLILPPFFSIKRIVKVKGLLLYYINSYFKFSLSYSFSFYYLLLVLSLTLTSILSFERALLTSFILQSYSFRFKSVLSSFQSLKTSRKLAYSIGISPSYSVASSFSTIFSFIETTQIASPSLCFLKSLFILQVETLRSKPITCFTSVPKS